MGKIQISKLPIQPESALQNAHLRLEICQNERHLGYVSIMYISFLNNYNFYL